MKKYYKVNEVAVMLGLHQQTIRRAIARGDLVATKNTAGGVYLISEEALNNYIKGEWENGKRD